MVFGLEFTLPVTAHIALFKSFTRAIHMEQLNFTGVNHGGKNYLMFNEALVDVRVFHSDKIYGI